MDIRAIEEWQVPTKVSKLILVFKARELLLKILHEPFNMRHRYRVSYERDTKIINAASFTIEREDHTIGNIVRMQLHRDENVLFAGYKLPHPLQYKIIVRIHTTSQSSPMQAYNQAINDLDKELDYLKNAFEVTSLLSSCNYEL
ncbi:hypothetical protein TEA_016689 [Camellia sinensis var. sinensis]|uniref:DNA-directed RNA polymerase RBP11-like dimerisation domain-containing protein n=1 Tax=Camellia sinensis var. sinensis TaxID=542762 RepID=A0A4S4DSW3_CAMSN|nr:hypothetical protein TEA_016689 [Camellia sinensis var. sinensis]